MMSGMSAPGSGMLPVHHQYGREDPVQAPGQDNAEDASGGGSWRWGIGHKAEGLLGTLKYRLLQSLN